MTEGVQRHKGDHRHQILRHNVGVGEGGTGAVADHFHIDADRRQPVHQRIQRIPQLQVTGKSAGNAQKILDTGDTAYAAGGDRHPEQRDIHASPIGEHRVQRYIHCEHRRPHQPRGECGHGAVAIQNADCQKQQIDQHQFAKRTDGEHPLVAARVTIGANQRAHA